MDPIRFAKGPIRFAKGHGTQNDFVLLLDPDGDLELSGPEVARLCDRRAGIGGDGLIRAVRDGGRWFMDYRNGDGSFAQMCGNGARVFVAYLLHEHLVELADGEGLAIGTRAGTKTVSRAGADLAVDLGPWRVVGGEAAAASGRDATVRLRAGGTGYPVAGLSVDVGNPHVVVALPDAALLAAVDLSRAPVVEPEPVDGVNVELVVPGEQVAGIGRLAMRVHERGVGETRSCGTGAAAAALAARVWAGAGAPDRWLVDVAGGRLQVRVPAGALLDGPSVELAGPAIIVATGVLEPGLLAVASDLPA